MKLIYKFYGAMFMIVTLSILTSCDDGYDPDVNVNAAPELPISGVLPKVGTYNILTEALSITGLDATLDGMSSITLLAPNDDAFGLLFDQLGVTNVTEIDQATLSTILQYHVVDGALASDELTRKMQTLTGSNLFITQLSGPSINGNSLIVDADRVGTNGFFHGISRVLTEPTGNIIDVLEADTVFTRLIQALEITGLDAALSGTTDFTLMAPTDTAFAQAGIVDVTAVDVDELTAILGFHVFPNAIFSQEFPTGEREETIEGSESEGQQLVNVSSNLSFNGVSIQMSNAVANNGVVHKMEGVIFPQFTLANAFDPAINATGNDGFGVDAFGGVIDAINMDSTFDISTEHTVYCSFTDIPGAFATPEEALEYASRHTFEGSVLVPSLDNGDRITSVGGDEYFIATTEAGAAFVNGLSRNGFGATSAANTSVYDGTVYIWNASFNPLPSDSLHQVLAANGYTLAARAIAIADKKGNFNSGANTFLTISDAEFTSQFGFSNVADLDTLLVDSQEDDLDIIEDLAEFIDGHTLTNTYFNVTLTNDAPNVQNNLSEDLELVFTELAAVAVRQDDNNNADVNLITSLDLLFNNGVIHEIATLIDIKE